MLVPGVVKDDRPKMDFFASNGAVKPKPKEKAKRWLNTSLGLVILILLVAALALFFSIADLFLLRH